ncbi:MAG TPA: TlpA disulfide reductase family protein [Bacteroidales bacterium]|nr:TlpA disulfide reductase family protein [Bacteroidales bacterium]
MRALLTTFISMIIITSAGAQGGKSTLTEIGQVAPAFQCTTVDGDVINSGDLKGKVIWVNFFATWCPPCKKELPVLQKNVMKKYQDNDDFVLVVLGREHNMEEMKAYRKKTGLDLPFAPDEERKIFSKYASQSIPRNVIIGKDGKIAVQSIGFTEQEFSKLEKELAALLAE